jgi:hypothetical protein
MNPIESILFNYLVKQFLNSFRDKSEDLKCTSLYNFMDVYLKYY